MFRQLPIRIPQPPPDASERARKLFTNHPLKVVAYMESYWDNRYNLNQTNREGDKCVDDSLFSFLLGHPYRLSDEPAVAQLLLPNDQKPAPVTENGGLPTTTVRNADGTLIPKTACPRLRWDHLIYAYMIENTRVFEIFRRVLHEYLHVEIPRAC